MPDDNAPPPPPPPGDAAPPRRRRWLGWALGASVCINLLVIGVAAGAMLRHWGPPAAEIPAGFDQVTLWRVFKTLPDEDRDAVRDLLRSRRDDLRGMARERREARRGIAEVVEAEPYAPDAVAEALSAARLVENRSRDLADGLFVEFAGRLSPETRAEIAEALRERRRGPGHGHGRWRDKDDRERSERDGAGAGDEDGEGRD